MFIETKREVSKQIFEGQTDSNLQECRKREHKSDEWLEERQEKTAQLEQRGINQQEALDELSFQSDKAENILIDHFKEVIRRHHVILTQKNEKIEELEKALERYRKEDNVEPICREKIHEQPELKTFNSEESCEMCIVPRLLGSDQKQQVPRGIYKIKHTSMNIESKGRPKQPLIGRESFGMTDRQVEPIWREEFHEQPVLKNDNSEEACQACIIPGLLGFYKKQHVPRARDTEMIKQRYMKNESTGRLKKPLIDRESFGITYRQAEPIWREEFHKQPVLKNDSSEETCQTSTIPGLVGSDEKQQVPRTRDIDSIKQRSMNNECSGKTKLPLIDRESFGITDRQAEPIQRKEFYEQPVLKDDNTEEICQTGMFPLLLRSDQRQQVPKDRDVEKINQTPMNNEWKGRHKLPLIDKESFGMTDRQVEPIWREEFHEQPVLKNDNSKESCQSGIIPLLLESDQKQQVPRARDIEKIKQRSLNNEYKRRPKKPLVDRESFGMTDSINSVSDYVKRTKQMFAPTEGFNRASTNKSVIGINTLFLNENFGISKQPFPRKKYSRISKQQSEGKITSNRTNERINDHKYFTNLMQTNIENERRQHKYCPIPTTDIEQTTDRELQSQKKCEDIANLEWIGHGFLRRLDFEEQMDGLHWQLEARGLNPADSGDQGLEMLSTTRQNLLKALKELRWKRGLQRKKR